MEYSYVTKNDPDEMSKPENLTKVIPNYGELLDHIADMRRATDDAAKSGASGQRLAGYVGNPKDSGLKVIARFPQALLTVLLEAEPDLLCDAKTFKKYLAKHPEFRAYSPGSKL